MTDYHMHTPYCRHASGPMEAYVEEAQRQGLEEICFTPHIPLPGFPRGPERLRMPLEDFDRYLEELERVRALFPGYTILSGVEADYYEGYEDFLGGFLEGHPFDFVLMSVHFIRDWPGENWVFVHDFPGRSPAEIYRDYFQALRKGVATGLFDCLAHFDLIKRAGLPVTEVAPAEVDELAGLCARAGMSIEVNTSGMRRPLAEPYPARAVLERFAARGVPVVTGSDAHEPHLVGFGFGELERMFAGIPGLRRARYRRRRITERPPLRQPARRDGGSPR